MSDTQRKSCLVTGIFVIKVALALFVFFHWGQGRLLWSDSGRYVEIAQALNAGHGYIDPIRTPLYPFLLAFLIRFFSQPFLAAALFQALMAAASAVILYDIARMFLSPRGSIAAVILFAFEPLGAIINFLILPETLLVFFLLLFTRSFLRFLKEPSKRDLVLSALFLAGAVWTKPVMVYLWVVPIVLIVSARKKEWFCDAVLFAAAVFAAFLPWMVYNAVTFGTFSVSSHDKDSVCGYLLTSVYSVEYGKDPSDMAEGIFPPSFRSAKERCTSSIIGLEIATLEHPQAFSKALVLSALSFFTNDGYTAILQPSPEESIKAHHNYLTPVIFADAGWRTKIPAAWHELGENKRVVVAVGKLFWIFNFIASILGVVVLLHQRQLRMPVLFLVLIILYSTGVTVLSSGFGVSARLRYPINPFLFIFALAGLASLVQHKNIET